jgi:RNA polymerase sigma factor for flagellar operon FliA
VKPVLSAESHKLVETHIGLARSIAAKVHRLMGRRVEFDDLVAQALQGLSEAADRYDPGATTPFGVFAHHRIRGSIFDWLRTMGYLQRRSKGREPPASVPSATPGPETDGCAVTRELDPIVLEPLPALRITYLAAGDDDERNGVLSVHSTEPPADAVLAEKHKRACLAGALHRLPARERTLLLKHYFEDKTMTEAGAELGLSRYQSCRLHARAVARLRESLAADGFRRASDL